MKNPVQFLRVANFVEAISYVILGFFAWVYRVPVMVKYLGWAHGLLFAVFCWGIVRVVFEAKWPVRRVVGVFLAALVPLVPFFVDRRFGEWVKDHEARQSRATN